jgi:uncharacterized protein DUF5939
MYYPEFKQLREANPELSRVISTVDRYLASLDGSARSHISASTVAAATDVPRDKVLGILMAAANLGLLKLKFRLLCPVEGSGIRDYDNLKDIPTEVYCDTCNEMHRVTTDDVEYYFELSEKSAAARR